MVAISRSKTKLWIVPAGTAASTLVSTSPYSSTTSLGYITGEVKSYTKSGGENDVESDPVFGGFVDKEKPQSQFELEFEIVPSIEKDIWEAMVYGEDASTSVLTSAAGAANDQAVFISAENGATSQIKGWGFNNCNVTVLDQAHNADDNQTQTLRMKFSPTDDNGVANFIYNSTARDTSMVTIQDLPDWSALDNN